MTINLLPTSFLKRYALAWLHADTYYWPDARVRNFRVHDVRKARSMKIVSLRFSIKYAQTHLSTALTSYHKMPLTRPHAPIESRAAAGLGAQVIIRHPGYEDDPDPLIVLTGHDYDGENKGLHFGTALLICSVLSGLFDGYFTAGQNGSSLTHDSDGLMEESTYYCQVPNDPQYPIYLSFGH